LQIFDIASGELIAKLEGHTEEIYHFKLLRFQVAVPSLAVVPFARE
jgi:hypothetical protein